MKYRHEWKHEINYSDLLAIRQRMRAVGKMDEHAEDGKYVVRSLYFDNMDDKALLEKIDGVNKREKFRIRYYDEDLSYIQLEKKSKLNGLCKKEAVSVTKEQVEMILRGEYDWIFEPREGDEKIIGMRGKRSGTSEEKSEQAKKDKKLLYEFYSKCMGKGLHPKTIVSYTREAFVYAPGNVRVTLDYNIQTGMRGLDFLNPHCAVVSVKHCPIILEVKWDEFLPDIIRNVVQLRGRHSIAFSKYAACRVYG